MFVIQKCGGSARGTEITKYRFLIPPETEVGDSNFLKEGEAKGLEIDFVCESPTSNGKSVTSILKDNFLSTKTNTNSTKVDDFLEIKK